MIQNFYGLPAWSGNMDGEINDLMAAVVRDSNAFFADYKTLFLNRYKITFDEELEKFFTFPENLEKMLYDHNCCGFFRDESAGIVCLPVEQAEKPNAAGIVHRYRPIPAYTGAFSGWVFDDRGRDFVLLKNSKSDLETPAFHLRRLADLKAELSGIFRQNLECQKTPFLVTGTYDDTYAVAETIKGIKSFAQAIFKPTKKAKASQAAPNPPEAPTLSALNLGVPFIGHDIQTVQQGIDSDALTYLGFRSLPIDKAERLVVGEVDSRAEIAAANYMDGYDCRKRAFDKLYQFFGVKATIEKKEEKEEKDYAPTSDTIAE